MDSRDHIIRIVLEARDRFSNVVKGMRAVADREINQIRAQWGKLGDEQTKLNKTLDDTHNRLHKTGSTMGALRQRADALSASIRKLRGEAKSMAEEDVFPLFGGGQARRGPGGRFEKIPTRREQVGSALNRARGGISDFFGGLSEGRKAAEETRKQIEKEIALTTEAHKQRLKELRIEEEAQRRSLATRIEDEKIKSLAMINDLFAERKRMSDDEAKAEIDSRIAEERRRFREFRRDQHLELTRRFRSQREQLAAPDAAGITARILADRKELEKTGTVMERIGRRTGLAFGDFTRGISAGRAGLRDLVRDGRRAETIFARLGTTIGRATRNLGTMVQLRWFIVVSALQLIGNLAVVVGANLVSLASSATLAAAALGGALSAAIGQLLVGFGLLSAVASRVSKVMDAVTLAEKNRLSAADDTRAQQDQQVQAAQRVEDANWTLRGAIEAVGEAYRAVREAEYDRVQALVRQTDAVKGLADAREQAAREIVDANFEERDAALSLQEAELGVLDAKRRLREEETKQRTSQVDIEDARLAVEEARQRLQIARAQGDQVEIGAANEQLSLAEQNLSSIQDQIKTTQLDVDEARVAVERAELTREQARVRNARAKEDAAEARREGIEGNEQVIQARRELAAATRGVTDAQHQVVLANRGVRDALHAVAVARREQIDSQKAATEATNKQTEAQKNLQEQLADLSPAERRLFNSLKRIQRIYRENFRPITDIIVNAIARAVDRAAVLLQDPKILNAARRLARSIAQAIDTISKFTLTREFRQALTLFLEQAAKNVPLLTRAFLALLRVFLRLGQVGAPIFSNLLGRFVGMVERLEVATRNPERLNRFFATARNHLDAWLELGKAVGDVLKNLIPSAAGAAIGKEKLGPVAPGAQRVGGGAPQGILGFFTSQLQRASKFFEENPESVTKFFENMKTALEGLAPLIGKTLGVLFQAFTSEEASAFTRVILEVVIPGLTLFIKALGLASRAIVFLLDLPIIGDLVKWGLAFGVAEKALNRVFPVTQKLTTAVQKLALALGRAFLAAVRNPSQFLRPFALLLDGVRLRMMYLRDAIVSASARWKEFAVQTATRARDFAKNIVQMAKDGAARLADLGKAAAVNARNGLLRFAAAARTAATAVATTLVGALRTVITLMRVQLVAAVRFLALVIRTNIRLIVGATGIGLLLLAIGLIYEHWDKISKFAKKAFDAVRETIGRFISWLSENWKKVAAIIIGIFTFPLGPIALVIYKFRDEILGVFTKIKDGLIGAFRAAIAWIREKFGDLTGWIGDKIEGIPGIGRFFKDEDDKKPKTGTQPVTPRPGERVPDPRTSPTAPRTPGRRPAPGDTITATEILDLHMETHGGLIERLREQGMTDIAILRRLVRPFGGRPPVLRRAKVLERIKRAGLTGTLPQFAKGGEIDGTSIDRQVGQAIPIMAHVGEWVLNKAQQMKVAKRLKMSIDQAKAWIFGTSMGKTKPGPTTTGTTSAGQPFRGPGFNLHPQKDDDGNQLWFIEMADGAWGQVTVRDAERIMRTKGEWIPKYVMRSTHGFNKIPSNIARAISTGHGFAMGGVVTPGSSIQKFAQGGTVRATPGAGGGGTRIGVGQQNFNVRTEGSTDWSYVMRLAAISATEV